MAGPIRQAAGQVVLAAFGGCLLPGAARSGQLAHRQHARRRLAVARRAQATSFVRNGRITSIVIVSNVRRAQ